MCVLLNHTQNKQSMDRSKTTYVHIGVHLRVPPPYSFGIKHRSRSSFGFQKEVSLYEVVQSMVIRVNEDRFFYQLSTISSL